MARRPFKKTWMVAGGVAAAVLLVGAAVTGARQLSRAEKERLLAEKQAEYNQLKAEYRRLAQEGDERAYSVGSQAKELAPVIGQLQAELGIVPDERLEMRFNTVKGSLQERINRGRLAGFSEESISTVQQYLQEVEALEQEFLQHTRSNYEINAELDELQDQWNPILDEVWSRETRSAS